ncbi:hypothetical protein GCM10023091_07310 [Ravibacter arvi]|uniref:Uncharacterized protein n=1 Tax=Ravibacter arvi TaxID=2051041 RepID=A0ABP8LSJ5_9BACT
MVPLKVLSGGWIDGDARQSANTFRSYVQLLTKCQYAIKISRKQDKTSQPGAKKCDNALRAAAIPFFAREEGPGKCLISF